MNEVDMPIPRLQHWGRRILCHRPPMDANRAKEIVLALAYGKDPVTGQQLPECSPYNAPDVIRALFMLTNRDAGYRHSQPYRAGSSWTKEEDEQLEREFHADVDFGEIAKSHNRSRKAITRRLERLGKLSPDAWQTSGHVE